MDGFLRKYKFSIVKQYSIMPDCYAPRNVSKTVKVCLQWHFVIYKCIPYQLIVFDTDSSYALPFTLMVSSHCCNIYDGILNDMANYHSYNRV